ncbi:hypothetical protein LCGC14_0561340 [marine sediment metagenome]|uniref:Major capsid protein E n=1 Tax=marine sediment metagenome TaxID=412755 RepID=A0A0F9S5J5_9ZZZZ
MSVLDVFTGNAFNVTSLTDAINKIPHKPGRIGQLGLFSNKGVTSRSVILEERDGVIQLLVSKPYGAPADVQKPQDRRARNFVVPHFPLDDTVLAEEVQGIRAFGSQSETEGVAQVVTQKIASMRQSHEVTLEWLRMGAIKGVVFDGDTTTVLHNLFNEFGVSKQADQDWDMHTVGTEQAPKCTTAIRLIEEALGAMPYDHIHCLMGDDVWDKFIVNTSVKTAYERWAGGLDGQPGGFLRSDMRLGFFFGGIYFENYRGKVGSTSFVAATEGRVFPVGAPGLFQTINAPADYIETVNTVGLPFYAKQERMAFDRGININTQSNPLNICTQPRTLIRIYGSA